MAWNYFIEKVIDRYSWPVLEYSLMYSPSTRVWNYSDSTALESWLTALFLYGLVTE